MTTPLFPTTVIGSLPRPAWLRDVILERKEGKLSDQDASRILDRAIESAILLQERAGLDEITDGEWRRENYVKVFAQRVKGFSKGDLFHPSHGVPFPAVVAPIEYAGPIVADEVPYMRARTKRRVKVTIPSPYIIGRRMWVEEHSKAAYPKREQFMAACVPILRREIEALAAAGTDTVQIDDPQLSMLVDAEYREKMGMPDVQYEMDLCVDLINQTLDGIKGVQTGVHLCHAHFGRTHTTQGPYDIIMPAVAKLRVGTVSLEYASPAAGGMDSLAKFPKAGPRLGLGCVYHCDRRVETPEEVVERVETAMRYVDKERITLHPDCGFAPSVQNPMDLDEAYLKLSAMTEAARRLRARHG